MIIIDGICLDDKNAIKKLKASGHDVIEQADRHVVIKGQNVTFEQNGQNNLFIANVENLEI